MQFDDLRCFFLLFRIFNWSMIINGLNIPPPLANLYLALINSKAKLLS